MGVRSFPIRDQLPDAIAVGDAVRHRVIESLKQRLSPKEYETWKSRMSLGSASPLSRVDEQILRKFDEVLIQEAATLGWRLYCYPAAMKRVSYWCDKSKDGLAFLKRFHKAIEAGVAANLGEEKRYISDPRWYETKQKAVKELKYLLGQCREAFRARHKAPEAQEIYSWFHERIAHLSSAVPFWHQNSTALLEYLKNDSNLCACLASGLVTRREAPSLFDRIFAYGYNVTEAHARKRISEHRPPK
jgi:hypothetical protein